MSAGFILALSWLCLTVAVAVYAERKGRNGLGWLLVALFLSPIVAFIMIAAGGDAGGAKGMRKCPFCAERVRAEAVKCKHCGSALTPPKRGVGITLAALALVIAATPASADLIKCKKPDGSLYVGPTPPENCVALGSVPATSSKAASAEDAALQTAAIESCKQAVAAKLVSPGSASWASIGAANRGGTHFDVGGSVDSQNKMGGLMRSNFVCEAEYVGGDRWSAHVSWLHDGGSGESSFDFHH